VLTYVLSHDHFGVNGSEGLAHNADLLRSDVININEDALGVFVATLLDVGPDLVFGLLGILFDGHIYYENYYY
jgi:hypothetical protein